MNSNLPPAEKRGLVAFVAGLVALSLFFADAPLSPVAALSGLAFAAAWSWYELSFKGYTKERWSTIFSIGLIAGVVVFVGVKIDLGLGGILGVLLVALQSKMYWSTDEAKEYWLDEEERRKLEAKRSRRR